jgi:hypothetical protein
VQNALEIPSGLKRASLTNPIVLLAGHFFSGDGARGARTYGERVWRGR